MGPKAAKGKAGPPSPTKKTGPAKAAAPAKAAPAKAPAAKSGAAGGKRAIPETLLKKRSRDQKVKDNILKARADRKKAVVEARKLALANGEKYFKEYAAADEKLIKDKRDAKAKGHFFVEGEPKVALVVRIRG